MSSNNGNHVVPEGHIDEENDINVKMIVGVGVVSLAAFAVCVVAGWMIMTNVEGKIERAGQPALIGRLEINMVDQQPYNDRRLLEEPQG